MDKKYLLGASLRSAKLARILAKFIDIGILAVLGFVFFPVGIFFGCLYLAIADSMQNGQSIGKKIIGFRVISLEDGTPCSTKQSFIRNLPLIVSFMPSIFPFWGWIISFLVGVPLIGLETYLIYKLDSGHRLGDVMADTTVMANDLKDLLNKKAKEKDTWLSSAGVRS